MKLGYTEFSFSYAFTENLIHSMAAPRPRPHGAPYFPNLIQEAGCGYDVRIDLPGCPLFFQYKLPELMVRSSAAEISQHSLACLSVPFFRMTLMRRNLSQQHRLLVDLEGNDPNSVVYYVTPGMKNVVEFNDAYNRANVHCESVFFSPKDIGPLQDDEQHVIAYRNGLNHAWLCSEPRKISTFQFEVVNEKVNSLLEDQRYGTLAVVVENIREVILSLVLSRHVEASKHIVQSRTGEFADPTESHSGISEHDIRSRLSASEDAIRSRIRARRVVLPDRPEISYRTREVAEELLVSREIARVCLGLDMLIAQPSA